tara:strand:- start:462 stop:629 length:168 start_codon:yes stop_codon:yes gene_type:complete
MKEFFGIIFGLALVWVIFFSDTSSYDSSGREMQGTNGKPIMWFFIIIILWQLLFG